MNAISQYVTTGSFKTHYLELGKGEPLILIHGGGAGADAHGNWISSMPGFAEHFRVIAVDMVGFGRSDAPDPATFDFSQSARNRQLIALIEALKLEKVAIVGNSMGGATALGVAMERPDLIGDLILMGSAGIRNPVRSAAPVAAITGYDFTPEGMVRIVGALTAPGFSLSKEMLDYRYRLSIKPEIRAAYAATMGWVKANGLGYDDEKIAAVKHRTLVVGGKNDQIIPLSANFRFLELIENSTGYFLPHCGHWAMMEQPEAFSAAVKSFIAQRGLQRAQ